MSNTEYKKGWRVYKVNHFGTLHPKVATDSFFYLEILIISIMIGRFCMTCYQMVARYEDGKILCMSHGLIKPSDFCEDHRVREEILIREPNGAVKPLIGYPPTSQ
jgi:hypothetical protein